MAVADGSAVLQQQRHHSSARAALAVCAAAVVLVGYFVVSSSITVLRPGLCGQFVSDAPALSDAPEQAWQASQPRGVETGSAFGRVGFVDLHSADGPVLHSLTGAELQLQPARSTC